MKLASVVHRALTLVTLGAALVVGAGCPARKVVAPPPPTIQQPTGDAALTADGKHFAMTRKYQGECMPAGSRGGCYWISLEPDGSYQHMLLDAAVRGTYEIKGDQVELTPTGEMPPQAMTLSADRTKLGDFEYQPYVEP